MPPEPTFIPKPGQIDFTHVRDCPVINCVVMHDGKMLLLKKNPHMKFYGGYWHCMSGFIDEPEKSVQDKVLEELHKELGISRAEVFDMSIGEKVFVSEDPTYGKVWHVTPVMVHVTTADVKLDWEAEEHIWIDPKTIDQYQTIPGLPEILKYWKLI